MQPSRSVFRHLNRLRRNSRLLFIPETAIFSYSLAAERCCSSTTQSKADRNNETRRKLATLHGTVQLYQRHVVILDSINKAKDWPPKLETSDHILAEYHKAYSIETEAQKKANIVKFTVAEDITRTNGVNVKNHSILVFPEGFRVLSIPSTHVSTVVQLVTSKQAPLTAKDFENKFGGNRVEHLEGKDVLVCAHSSRDFRCGCSGPKLISWFEAANKCKKERCETLRVWPVSHIGGHRYAGNCIVYPGGDWYGHVNSKEDVEDILACEPSSVVQRLWRGRIGMTKDEQNDMAKFR